MTTVAQGQQGSRVTNTVCQASTGPVGGGYGLLTRGKSTRCRDPRRADHRHCNPRTKIQHCRYSMQICTGESSSTANTTMERAATIPVSGTPASYGVTSGEVVSGEVLFRGGGSTATTMP